MHVSSVKKLLFVLLAVFSLSAFSGALWGQVLQIHYINVQQGQSTLIIGPNGTTILFDGGYETKGTTEVVPYLQSIGIPVTQTLNYIVASHRDTDHFVGLTEVMNYGYNAYHVYDNGSDKTNTYVTAFLTAAASTTAGGVTALVPGTVIDLGFGATATCVAANGSVVGSGAVSGGTSDENDRAICLLIKYNGFDFLLNGDMGGGSEDNACTGRGTTQINMESPTVFAIMPAGGTPLLSQYGVEVAHVGHHGSESSTNADYMNLLTPMVACIAVGAGQSASYMHPRIDVLNVLLKNVPCITAPAALVLQTEEGNPIGANTSTAGNAVGDIVITTDGINSYTVSASGAVSQGPDERTAAGLPRSFYFEEYTAADNAPILYNVRSSGITTVAADIAWSSNEAATSVVRYGTTAGSYTSLANSTSLVLNHSLALASLTPATTYYYVVDSTDETSHTTTSAEYSFQTLGLAETVSTPTTPSGPATGLVSTSYNYTTGGSTSSLGDGVQYQFDWGDGSNSGWLAAGTTQAAHSWTAGGTYNVRAMARCATHTAVTSSWSTTLAVVISGGSGTGNVVFSEVYYDTIGTDAVEEWFELYNNSALTVNVGGWTVNDNNGAGGTVTIPAGTTMAPGTYMTVAANSAGFLNLYHYEADFYYGTVLALGNSGDVLVLKDNLGTLVDAVSWEGGFSGTVPAGWGSTTLPNAATGYSIVRANVAVDTNTYADWTTAPNNGNPQTRPVTINSITVTAPNGGESWIVGTAHAITWTSSGTVGSVDLHYSTDNGTSWTLIASGEANDGSYNWTVPVVTPATTCRVRVQEADGTPTDASDAAFTIAASALSSGVVISEVYYDTIGTDAIEEWVELYNASATAADIGGWTIYDNYPAGGHVTIPTGTTIAPYSYFTVAANSVGFNALYGYDADYYYGTAIALGNSGDALLLRDLNGVLKDAVSYEGGSSGGLPTGWGSTTLPSAATGSSIVRTPVSQDTDTYADWTTAANNGRPQTQLKVVFSEVYYDTVGTDAVEEWIELYNNSGRTVDIGGCTVVDNNGGASYGTITIPAGTRMLPYSYLTVAADSAGFRNLYQYEADLYYGTAVALGNSGDALLLRDPQGNLVDTVAWEGGTSAGVPAGWGSTSLPSAATGSTIVRTDVAVDTNTYADWTTAANNGQPRTQRRYTLTIAVTGDGATDPAAGPHAYGEGETVAIKATAASGSRFDAWSGDASGTADSVSVLMNGNKAVTATFVRQYTLTVVAGAGGTTNPLPGPYTFDAGTALSVEAFASSGYRFSGWSGDASGTANPLAVTLNGDMTVTADFIRQYTLTIAAGAGGTTNPLPGPYTYDAGTAVPVQAIAAAGYRFSGWSDGATGTSNPVTVTVNNDMTVSASFIRQYTLAIAAGEGGTTNPPPGLRTYDEGALVYIEAFPAPGYHFAGWGGDASGSVSWVRIRMDGDRSVTASFARFYSLTIAAGAGGTTNPAPGTYLHDTGTAVSIQALPAPAYEFVAWSGSASGSANPLAIVMDRNMAVQANFARVVKAPLALTAEKLVNRSVSMVENIIKLRWQPNSANSGTISYRIYRIVYGRAMALADVAPGTSEYIVHGTDATAAYDFGITAVNGDGWESDMVLVTVR